MRQIPHRWGKGGIYFYPGVKVIKISQRHRRLFPNDAIGIWVLTGKSIEEWLKIKGFKAWWGSSRWVVGPAFSCFWMPLIGWRLGKKSYYQAKVGSFRDSIRVLRDSIRVSVFVWSFACL
ncbi:hypothetical protein D5281_18465 [bacterium 1xD42-62]|uniref:Uncharacterized protein n=1 Tax=Parablautia muri TaxID=2320879 RepID=A0A9X5BK75_9FIRM|nr:hypothetical protein [Parablautia muri]